MGDRVPINSINYRKICIGIVAFLFILYITWWLLINLDATSFGQTSDYFSDSYGAIALWGSLVGVSASTKWGGKKSILGKAILFLSYGLLFQYLGQLSYAYYRQVLNIDHPYPSIGEVFYFGSIPIYIISTILLMKAIGLRFSIKRPSVQMAFLLLPFAMISFAYYVFIDGYDFVDTSLLVIFLDVSYPTLQALQVSLAVLTFILARQIYGGKLQAPILLVILSFVTQYSADTVFTYRSIYGLIHAGDIADLLYILSYTIMSLTLYNFGKVYEEITNGK